jgi:GMP synthase (glutamine-hydrolysing)
MKPFLILQLRVLDEAADSEYYALLKYGGLNPENVKRVRMEKESFAEVVVEQFSGIIVGGGPSNVSDDEASKPDYQKRFEAELNLLYEQILEKDTPYLGLCYGLGSLMRFMGGEVSKRKYSEEVGYTSVTLNESANKDPLLEGLPEKFNAFVGHKEACQEVVNGGILLASSDACPVQMVRFKENIYAAQFHCELDAQGIAERVQYYKDHGYFDPNEAHSIIEKTKGVVTTEAGLILKRFIGRYKQ